MASGIKDKVAILGMGCAKFGERWDKDADELMIEAFEEAVTIFTEVIEMAPDFAEGYNKRATTYYLIQEYEKSIRDCDTTIALNPVHFGGLSGAGLCYLGLRNLPKALDYFERAIAVNPNMQQIQGYVEEIKKFLRDQST